MKTVRIFLENLNVKQSIFLSFIHFLLAVLDISDFLHPILNFSLGNLTYGKFLQNISSVSWDNWDIF